MKKTLAIILLSAAVLLAGCAHPQPVYGPPPPAVQVHDQGIHDGFEAARSDVAAGRQPSFAAHPRYRNPPVPPPAFRDYREGFRQGYEQFLHHGAPPQPPPGY